MKAHREYQYRGYCSRSGYDRPDEILRECAVLYNVAL